MTRPFSQVHRAADIADATAEVVDVLIVGAGATGAGVALDAASRGLSAVVVDKGDLASGTSSKSSKLIHGGLRYLENYEFGLVYEGVNERQLLQRLAPHLVRPMDFIYPVFDDTPKVRLLGLGLTTYDVLAGFRNIRRHDRISPERAIELAPALAGTDMARAYLYGDCATDDARLVLAVVRAARRFGAVALTYTEATALLRDDDGRVTGARLADQLTGAAYDVRARHVVNATGVWVDRLLQEEEPGRPVVVQPSKGVHLVVPRERIPLDNASILLPSRQGDGRSMFAIPWGGQTVLGTTDTSYDGSLDDVSVEQADLDYVLAATNALFDRGLTEDDVVGAWAGCRPLLKGVSESMSDLSRRHTIYEGIGGLLTITGGKLTTYRRMARDVVDRIVDRDDRKARCRTDEIALGCTRALEDVTADARAAAATLSLSAEFADVSVRQHGEAAPDVLSLAGSDPSYATELSAAAPHVLADVVWAARREGAATLDDVYSRRTRLSLRARDAGLSSAPLAAETLARELGQDSAWAEQQVADYARAVRRERGVVPVAGPVAPSVAGAVRP